MSRRSGATHARPRHPCTRCLPCAHRGRRASLRRNRPTAAAQRVLRAGDAVARRLDRRALSASGVLHHPRMVVGSEARATAGHGIRQMRVVIVNKYVHLTGGADQHCLGLAAGASAPRPRGALPVHVRRAQRGRRRRVRVVHRDPRVARVTLTSRAGRSVRQGALEPRGRSGDAAAARRVPTRRRAHAQALSAALRRAGRRRGARRYPGRPDAPRLRDDQREPDRRSRRTVGSGRDAARGSSS